MKWKTARQLRKDMGALSFPYWVRCFRDGEAWIGRDSVSGTTDANRDEIMARLIALGYHPVSNGTPGTSGYNIVEIKVHVDEIL